VPIGIRRGAKQAFALLEIGTKKKQKFLENMKSAV